MRSFVLAAACAVPLVAQAQSPLDLRVVTAPDQLDARLVGAPPGALVAFVLGVQHGSTPLPGGRSMQLVPITVAGLASASAAGVATCSITYPVGNAAGLTVLAQAIAFDPTFPLGDPRALHVSPLRPSRVPLAGEEADIVVLFGQSNAEGATSLQYLPGELRDAHPQLRVWNDAAVAWQPLAAGVNNMLVPGMPTVGPEIGLTQAMGADTQPLWLVKCAVWASSLGPTPGPLNEWGPQAGELYPEMLRRIDAACVGVAALGLVPRVRLVAMMQGESDALDPLLAAAYATNLQHLLTQLRADLGARGVAPLTGPHFRLGLIHPSLVDAGFGHVQVVRAAQMATAAIVTGCDLVETRGMDLMPDRVHLSLAGSLALGGSFVRGFLRR